MISDLSNYDHTKKCFDDVVPRLRKALNKLGVKINEQVFVPPDICHRNAVAMKNRLWKKYYGTDDIQEVYKLVESNTDIHSLPEDQQEFIGNFRRARSAQLNENDVALTCKWSVDYDPVSKLLFLIRLAIEADNTCFNYSTEDGMWLEHNLGYLKKIGFSSQYYPQVLIEAGKAYARTGDVIITDQQIDALAMAAKVQQDAIIKLRCEQWDVSRTHAEALEKNNKAAESSPGFRNQKNPDVKEEVLKDTQFLIDYCDESDIQLYNEQHRIQSGGNVLLDYCKVSLDKFGRVTYSFEQFVAAVKQIKSERGTFNCYYEDEPQILPELVGVITYDSLPSSGEERQRMVDAGEAPEYILKRFKDINDWQYKYVLTCPNVFTTVHDKFPDLVDLADRVYTKHRSVKASPASFSRLGQTFLYPFMEAEKSALMKGFKPYYSMAAQWTHPDNLKQLFTDAIVASVPDLYKDLKMSTTYSPQQLAEFRSWISDRHMTTYTTSDDKSGFDTLTKIYMLWLYFTTFLSIPFEMNEKNVRLMRLLCAGVEFPVVSCVDGIHIYSEIIPSGAFCTSHLGTYCSNLQSLNMRYTFAGCTDVDGVNNFKIDHTEEHPTSVITQEGEVAQTDDNTSPDDEKQSAQRRDK